jgi:hypothetical protein
MVPSYLKTFRQAIRKPESYEVNEIDEKRGTEEGLNSSNSFNSFPVSLDLPPNPRPGSASDRTPTPYQVTFDALERRCPDLVPKDRWKRAIEDAQSFLAAWGRQAHALDWTERELFGLHPAPKQPAANCDRLARLDDIGVVWLLRGQPVVALTATEASYRCSSGAILTYRRERRA